jgi:polar amino acid transport system substrate-binding protein
MRSSMRRVTRSLVMSIAAGGSLLAGCTAREKVTSFEQLDGRQFGIPTGTVVDQLVLSKLPKATFLYFTTVLDAAMAVKAGKVDVAAYDEPILRNIAAKNPGLVVLPQKITTDDYGFAVRLGDVEIKNAVDSVIHEVKATGEYEQMVARWLPASGAPQPMPAIATGTNGVLRFGTAAVTEPFSFVDASRQVVGMDVEFAARTAAKLGRRLEIVNMDFGAMIPALMAGKVDMIGACITITAERRKSVLFSDTYYVGGISALVRQ